MANVLITDCGSDVGHHAALDLARSGHRVIATVWPPGESLELSFRAFSEGLPLSVHDLDVTSTRSVEEVIAMVGESAGPIDAVVKVAEHSVRGPVDSISDAEFLRCFDTNLFSIVRLVRAVVPSMRARRKGTIVNVSSISGLVGIPYEGPYTASKYAIEALSDALSFELAPSNIRVRLVLPGGFVPATAPNIDEAVGFSSDHPLWGEYQRFWPATARFAGQTDNPIDETTLVVNAIHRAVLDDDAPYRQLVGHDVEVAWAAKHAAGLDDTAPMLRAVLGLDLPTGAAARPS